MNRDEQRTRAAEHAPALWAPNGLFAPRDPVGGGTWIGLTNHGHWACIMNSYTAHTAQTAISSRGNIIPYLLAQDDPSAALRSLDLTSYRPFRLILGTHTYWQLYHANGRILVEEARTEGHDVMFSSSSWNADAVLAARHQAFIRWQKLGSEVDTQGIPTLHRWQEVGDEKTTILMQRPESCTTSITQIVIATNHEAPTMHYWPALTISPLNLH